MDEPAGEKVYHLKKVLVITGVIFSLFVIFPVLAANRITNTITSSLVHWQSATPLPYRRGIASHELVVCDSNLYVLGGEKGGSERSDLVYYTTVPLCDPTMVNSTSAWLSTAKPLTLPVSLSSATTWIDKWIYLIGGYETNAPGSGRYTNTTYYAQPDANGDIKQWYQLNSRHLPRVALHSCETVGDYVFCMGGWQLDHPISDTYVINLDSENGISQDQDWQPAKELPTPTYRHATLAHQNIIYVIGGYVLEGQTRVQTRSIFSGTVVSDTILGWEFISTLPITLSHFSAEINHGWLYVIGGKDEAGDPVSGVYRIPIEAIDDPNAWEKVHPLWRAVYNHDTAISEQGVIHLVGGQTGSESFSSDTFCTPLAFLTKFHDPRDEVTYGNVITYIITCTNNGLRDLSRVLITDTLPLNTCLLSVSGQPVTEPISWDRNGINVTVDGVNAGSTITWGFGTLPITSSDQVSFVVQVFPSEVATSRRGAQPLAEGFTGTQSVLPDWFAPSRMETSRNNIANRLPLVDAKITFPNCDLAAQESSSRYMSTTQLDPMSFPVCRNGDSSPVPVIFLGSHSVTTDTVSPQCVPTILAVHPNTLCNDMVNEITIEGTDFRSTPRVQLEDTELPSVTFVSPNTLTAIISHGMSGGFYSVTVMNPGTGDLSDTLTNAVTVVHAALAVTGVQPISGTNNQETVITVTGENLRSTPTLMLEDVELSKVGYLSSTVVTAVIPLGLTPGFYDLTLTNPKPCQRSATVTAAFLVTPSPVIVANRAYLCIGDVGCVPSNPAMNTPYEVYLPFTTKSYAAP